MQQSCSVGARDVSIHYTVTGKAYATNWLFMGYSLLRPARLLRYAS
jgi:hypothetical protein